MKGWHKHQGVPGTPKNADVICEQPLTCNYCDVHHLTCRLNAFSSALSSTSRLLLVSGEFYLQTRLSFCCCVDVHSLTISRKLKSCITRKNNRIRYFYLHLFSHPQFVSPPARPFVLVVNIHWTAGKPHFLTWWLQLVCDLTLDVGRVPAITGGISLS